MTTVIDQTPSVANPSLEGPKPAMGFSHVGERYVLGFGDDFFAIYDRRERRLTPSEPVATFPRTEQGWADAWRLFTSWEPHSREFGPQRPARQRQPQAPLPPPPHTEPQPSTPLIAAREPVAPGAAMPGAAIPGAAMPATAAPGAAMPATAAPGPSPVPTHAVPSPTPLPSLHPAVPPVPPPPAPAAAQREVPAASTPYPSLTPTQRSGTFPAPRQAATTPPHPRYGATVAQSPQGPAARTSFLPPRQASARPMLLPSPGKPKRTGGKRHATGHGLSGLAQRASHAVVHASSAIGHGAATGSHGVAKALKRSPKPNNRHAPTAPHAAPTPPVAPASPLRTAASPLPQALPPLPPLAPLPARSPAPAAPPPLFRRAGKPRRKGIAGAPERAGAALASLVRRVRASRPLLQIVLVLIAALVAVAAVAIATSGKSASPRDRFLAQASPYCSKLSTQITAIEGSLPSTASPTQVARAVSSAAGDETAAYSQLEKLPVPTGDSAALSSIWGLATQTISYQTDLAQDLSANQTAAATQNAAFTVRTEDALNGQLAAYGLGACAVTSPV